jgi:hypothetical protein
MRVNKNVGGAENRGQMSEDSGQVTVIADFRLRIAECWGLPEARSWKPLIPQPEIHNLQSIGVHFYFHTPLF